MRVGAAPPRASWIDVLQIVDIRTKIVSVSSLLIGSAYAWLVHDAFFPGLFAAMLLATLLVDMGTTGFNSYYDYLHGVDTVDSDVERWKALVQRGIDPAFARRLSWTLFALAAVVGLAIGLAVDIRIVAVGAACMAVAWLYSAGPVPIARLPVGEIFAGGLLGSALIGVAGFVQSRHVDAGLVLIGLPSTVFIATILSVNNACDIEGDRKAGRRTLAVLLGATRAERLIEWQMALTLALAIALVPLNVLDAYALVPLLAVAVLGFRELAMMHARGFSHATKAASMAAICKVFLAYTAAMLLGLAIGAWR